MLINSLFIVLIVSTAKDFHDPSGFDCLFKLIVLTSSWSVWCFFSFLCFHAEDSPYNVQLTEQGKSTECHYYEQFSLFKSLADINQGVN